MKQRMILIAWLLRMETGVETFLTCLTYLTFTCESLLVIK